MTDVDRTQSKQRLVSYDGDIADDAAALSKKPETKKETPAVKQKLYETANDQPVSCPTDRSTMSSGVSYADFAKNATQQKTAAPPPATGPVCDSMHTENCPVEGWTVDVKVIKDIGTRGVEITVGKTDSETKLGVIHLQGGLQNELSGTAVVHDQVGERNGVKATVTDSGPSGGIHFGFHNPDGSKGVNFASHAQIYSTGAKVEHDASGASGTMEGAVGVSFGGSIGIREKNGTQIAVSGDVGDSTMGGALPIAK